MSTGELDGNWFALLRCPFCGGSFQFTDATRPATGAAEFGVLACQCSRFPVVDGVPIIQRAPVGMFEHTTGRTEVPGIPVADLVALIEKGQCEEALLECLAVPAPLPKLSRVLPWRLTHGDAAKRLQRSLGKREFKKDVLERRKQISARGIFNFFYRPGRGLQPAVGQYFVLRFGQPRHLAALSLLAQLPADSRPVLDIACGAGHLEHYLTNRNRPVAAVGTDMNFFHVWIARHWMAPKARYVCSNARDGLPFVDNAFSATVCSDAYHYLHDRRRLLQEIERCAPARPVMLTRVGNRAVPPNEGLELSLDEYRREFGDTVPRVFDEMELLKAYLRRQNPLESASRSDEDLAEAKWLSFGWNLPPPATASDEWPHAVGEVGLNPIYRTAVTGDGDLRLNFEFPLAWYAYENHAMLTYHPQQVTVRRVQLMNLASWQEDAHLQALVHSFVLLGLPQRFYR